MPLVIFVVRTRPAGATKTSVAEEVRNLPGLDLATSSIELLVRGPIQVLAVPCAYMPDPSVVSCTFACNAGLGTIGRQTVN